MFSDFTKKIKNELNQSWVRQPNELNDKNELGWPAQTPAAGASAVTGAESAE
jgi:hypothetical protein